MGTLEELVGLEAASDLVDAADDDVKFEPCRHTSLINRAGRPKRVVPAPVSCQRPIMRDLPAYVRLMNGRTVVSHDAWLSSGQEYCDDLKFVNYDVIEFESLGISVEQDRRLGKGGHVWDGSFVLAESLTQSLPLNFAGSVLELGAGGTALAGLSIAKSRRPSRVVITDGDAKLLPLLKCNIQRNLAERIEARQLLWISQLADDDDQCYWMPPKTMAGEVDCLSDEKFDLVIAAECIAPIYDPQAFIAALLRHCHATSEIRLLGKDGRWPDHANRVYDLLTRHFRIVHLEQPASRLRSSLYCLAILRPKSS